MTFAVSPGAYFNTVDRSQVPTAQNPSIAAGVGAAPRGTLARRHCVSRDDLFGEYDKPNPTYGFGIDSGGAFLYEGKEFWYQRVVAPDARYALGVIANNVLDAASAGSTFTPIPSGSLVPHDQVNREVLDVEFSGPIATGHTITVALGADSTDVPYATSHLATMGVIAQTLQAKLDAVESDDGQAGYVTILPIPSASAPRVIRVIGPQATTISTSLSVTTAGAGAPDAAVYATDWLAFVVAENPGDWGSKVAAGAINLDVGIPQRVKLSINAVLTTGSTISGTFNGTVVSQVFTTDTNTTLAAFAAGIAAAMAGSSAAPVDLDAGVNGNRSILIVAPDARADMTIANLSVTGGSGSVLVSATQVLKRIAPTDTFQFVLYDTTRDDSFRTPTESWQATYAEAVDGLGSQLELEYQVNEGPSKSTLVRVYVNPLFTGILHAATSVLDSTTPRFLGGGDDGSLPTTQEVVGGWDAFADPDDIAVRILINGGYATPEVHQKMTTISTARRDCFSVLDMPSEYQVASAAVDYRRHSMDVDCRYGAIYSPDVLIYDSYMGKRRYIPPSGLVAAQYAYTDRVAYEWFAPAGLTRGLIRNALGLRVTYKEGDRDLLSPAQVNAIVNYKNRGQFAIWGEYTLQYSTSALQSVPVVRLLIAVEIRVADVVAYSVFEPNDKYTWDAATAAVTDLLIPIFRARGFIEMPTVVCNSDNNPPATRDLRQMRIDIWMKPTLPALYIKVTEVVTRQTAVVTEDIKAMSNVLF